MTLALPSQLMNGTQTYHLATRLGATLFQVRVPVIRNAATVFRCYCERAITVTSIQVGFLTKPTSAGGTYTLAASGAGNNLFNANTYDLEGLVSDTLTAVTLTAVGANLTLAAGSTITFTMTSNNTDLVGVGPELYMTYTLA